MPFHLPESSELFPTLFDVIARKHCPVKILVPVTTQSSIEVSESMIAIGHRKPQLCKKNRKAGCHAARNRGSCCGKYDAYRYSCNIPDPGHLCVADLGHADSSKSEQHRYARFIQYLPERDAEITGCNIIENTFKDEKRDEFTYKTHDAQNVHVIEQYLLN